MQGKVEGEREGGKGIHECNYRPRERKMRKRRRVGLIWKHSLAEKMLIQSPVPTQMLTHLWRTWLRWTKRDKAAANARSEAPSPILTGRSREASPHVPPGLRARGRYLSASQSEGAPRTNTTADRCSHCEQRPAGPGRGHLPLRQALQHHSGLAKKNNRPTDSWLGPPAEERGGDLRVRSFMQCEHSAMNSGLIAG